MELSFTYPGYFLLICGSLGLLYALFLYYGRGGLREGPGYIHVLLALLRGTLVAGLAFLLLGPLIRQNYSQTKKPILLIAQDVSASVAEGMETEGLKKYMNELNSLMEQLANTYDIRLNGIGEEILQTVPDTFDHQLSDLGSILPYWNELYEFQPVGAVILASDGIFNSGSDPVYLPYKLNAAFYAIGLGDTNSYPDLKVRRTFYNDVVYLGDNMLIETELASEKLDQAITRVSLEQKVSGKWQKKADQSVTFNGNSTARTSFRIQADKTGLNEYRIVLAPVENERVIANNTFNFFMDVIDARQRILIMAASPHPDITAIKQWLSNDERYEIVVSYSKDRPQIEQDIDLVIFHQLPAKGVRIDEMVKKLDQKKIPRMFITGRQTLVPELNKNQQLVTIKSGGDNFNEAQTLIAPDFQLFTLDMDSKQRMAQFPPLTTFFGEYELSPAARVLMNQRISKIETDYPLILMGEANEVRSAMILGEGIWRWRLFDQLQHDNDKVSREWFVKTIQYLSVIQDKRPFRILPLKRIFPETENIIFDARLYNANYEMVNMTDVPLTLMDENGTEYTYFFDRTGDSYTLDAGRFPPGTYRYNSSFDWNGERYQDQGSFSIQSISLESNELKANHQTLFKLCNDHNGRLVTPGQLSSLVSELRESKTAREVVVSTTQTITFISLKWPFFLLLLLASAEWIIRRIYGGL